MIQRYVLLACELSALVPYIGFLLIFHPGPSVERRYGGWKVSTVLRFEAASLALALGWVVFTNVTHLLGMDVSRRISILVGIVCMAVIAVAANVWFWTFLHVRRSETKR